MSDVEWGESLFITLYKESVIEASTLLCKLHNPSVTFHCTTKMNVFYRIPNVQLQLHQLRHLTGLVETKKRQIWDMWRQEQRMEIKKTKQWNGTAIEACLGQVHLAAHGCECMLLRCVKEMKNRLLFIFIAFSIQFLTLLLTFVKW